MDTNRYIVSQSAERWHASFKGSVLGPFQTRDEAVEAAIADATGKDVSGSIEVLVQEPNMEIVSVWRSQD